MSIAASLVAAVAMAAAIEVTSAGVVRAVELEETPVAEAGVAGAAGSIGILVFCAGFSCSAPPGPSDAAADATPATAGSAARLSFKCFPPELAYSHISLSGHAEQFGVRFSQNTLPRVIM
jgi:hypothetical protein